MTRLDDLPSSLLAKILQSTLGIPDVSDVSQGFHRLSADAASLTFVCTSWKKVVSEFVDSVFIDKHASPDEVSHILGRFPNVAFIALRGEVESLWVPFIAHCPLLRVLCVEVESMCDILNERSDMSKQNPRRGSNSVKEREEGVSSRRQCRESEQTIAPNLIHLRELYLAWSRSLPPKYDPGMAAAMCQSLLSTCPNIQKLSMSLFLPQKESKEFVHLAMNLHHLRTLKLDLHSDGNCLECFSQYESLPSVTCLDLHGTDEPPLEMLRFAKAFPNMQRLASIYGEGVWQLTMALSDLRFLTLLTVGDPHLFPNRLKTLASTCPKLEWLRLGECETYPSDPRQQRGLALYEHESQFPNLSRLSFACFVVSDSDLRSLASRRRFPNLQKLLFRKCGLTSFGGLEALVRLAPRLETLGLVERHEICQAVEGLLELDDICQAIAAGRMEARREECLQLMVDINDWGLVVGRESIERWRAKEGVTRSFGKIVPFDIDKIFEER
eukprot:TRINITY_DN1449_c0_g3_i1.p1 TRINITY_DN1449_c0_g3~~TRINITY_DN1449_c0_g3_i1.p1  ORF type:complete len:498 (+),score=36.79 TRINITY_DN1449_c0_g3_i1:369-1862(+)